MSTHPAFLLGPVIGKGLSNGFADGPVVETATETGVRHSSSVRTLRLHVSVLGLPFAVFVRNRAQVHRLVLVDL